MSPYGVRGAYEWVLSSVIVTAPVPVALNIPAGAKPSPFGVTGPSTRTLAESNENCGKASGIRYPVKFTVTASPTVTVTGWSPDAPMVSSYVEGCRFGTVSVQRAGPELVKFAMPGGSTVVEPDAGAAGATRPTAASAVTPSSARPERCLVPSPLLGRSARDEHLA